MSYRHTENVFVICHHVYVIVYLTNGDRGKKKGGARDTFTFSILLWFNVCCIFVNSSLLVIQPPIVKSNDIIDENNRLKIEIKALKEENIDLYESLDSIENELLAIKLIGKAKKKRQTNNATNQILTPT